MIGKQTLFSPEETLSFGRKIAAELDSNAILALSGDLGAGKTTFVQGLAEGLGITDPIQSPTFVTLNLYDGLYHFDLYRMKDSAEFRRQGFEEYFSKKGICAIEWPERIASLLPEDAISIYFRYTDQRTRTAEISLWRDHRRDSNKC